MFVIIDINITFDRLDYHVDPTRPSRINLSMSTCTHNCTTATNNKSKTIKRQQTVGGCLATPPVLIDLAITWLMTWNIEVAMDGFFILSDWEGLRLFLLANLKMLMRLIVIKFSNQLLVKRIMTVTAKLLVTIDMISDHKL